MDRFEDFVISSKDRSNTEYLYQFSQTLNGTIKNVKAIELISVILPNIGSVSLEPYLEFNVNKGQWRQVSKAQNNSNDNPVSWIIQPLPLNSLDPFIKCPVLTNSKILFHPKYETASVLYFEIRDYLGNLYTFSNLANGNSKNTTMVVTLRIYY